MQQLFDFKCSFSSMRQKHHVNFNIRLKRKTNMFGNPENAQRKTQKHRLLNMSDLWGVTAATLHLVHTVSCTYALMLNEIIREGQCQLDLSCTVDTTWTNIEGHPDVSELHLYLTEMIKKHLFMCVMQKCDVDSIWMYHEWNRRTMTAEISCPSCILLGCLSVIKDFILKGH